MSKVPPLTEVSQPKPQSIQVVCTIINGAGVQMTTLQDEDATHLSIYIRQTDGTCVWQRDYGRKASGAYNLAITYAAQLSMEHFVPIEPIPGDIK